MMQDAAFTISGKWPKSAFFGKKWPFFGTKITLAHTIFSFLEIPLVEMFYELRGTFWRMFQGLGVASFCVEFFFKMPKFDRNFLNFLFPKNSFNVIISASRDMSMPYFAWIDCDLMILGRKTPFWSIIDPIHALAPPSSPWSGSKFESFFVNFHEISVGL